MPRLPARTARGRLGAGERRGCRRSGHPQKWLRQSAGSGEGGSHGSRCSDIWRMPAGRGRRDDASRASGTGFASHRSRAGMARTRQRASYPDTAVVCLCQPDLSAGGRAAAFWRSASGRQCRFDVIRRTTTIRGRYCRSVGRFACRGRHRFPVRAVFSHRCGCPKRASTLNSFLPEHSVSTCWPAGCRSRLWAASCAPAQRVRAADCHHLPVRRLRGTQHAGDGPGWRQPEV